jgi:hypothetical protein
LIPLIHTRRPSGLVKALVAVLALAGSGPRLAGYAPPVITIPVDSLHQPDTQPAAGTSRVHVGAVIPGYLSSWGLPPVRGQVTLTDTGLVFQSARGSASTRASTVSLGYVDQDNGRAHYVFRVDAGVFETDSPEVLLEVVENSAWLKKLKAPRRNASGALVDATDPRAPLLAAQRLWESPYADSLYAVFGRPSAPVGLIGPRGRKAGRLGEYIAARDSLAFDPGRMLGEAQLRHALAHELGHRWQARSKAQLAMLWSGVTAIRDPKRYGYGEPSEHQAEAIAFAIDFLQTTADARDTPATSLALLEHYELLVPGTRVLMRYLLLQPIYRSHPLRSLLTTSRIMYAPGK